MKVLRQIYLIDGFALIGLGVWLIGDRWYGLVPIGFGIAVIYEMIWGDWAKYK